MKKTIIAFLLATTISTFANVFDDACKDFEISNRSKRMNILEYAEDLSNRISLVRKKHNDKEEDKLLKFFSVTVSTGLMFGINKNAAPELVGRLVTAMERAYTPLSQSSVSTQELVKSLTDMDEIYQASQRQGTSDQFSAVLRFAYETVGLSKVKPWEKIDGIEKIKITSPSKIFSSFLKELENKSPNKKTKIEAHKPEDLTVVKSLTAFNYSNLDHNLQSLIKEEYEILRDLEKISQGSGLSAADSTEKLFKSKGITFKKPVNSLDLKFIYRQKIASKLTSKGILTVIKVEKQKSGYNLTDGLFLDINKKHVLPNHQVEDCYLEIFDKVLRINENSTFQEFRPFFKDKNEKDVQTVDCLVALLIDKLKFNKNP